MRHQHQLSLVQAKPLSSNAKDLDEEWIARFKLVQSRHVKAQVEELLAFQLANVDPNKPKPALSKEEAVPFWELERMRQALNDAQDSVLSLERDTRDQTEPPRGLQLALKQARIDERLYRRALEQCQEECARSHPGMTFAKATGIPSADHVTRFRTKEETAFERKQTRAEIAMLKEWLANIPEEAERAKGEVEFHIGKLEESIQYSHGVDEAREKRELSLAPNIV
ncbi:hypothetical protein NQ176_g4082 [Zarea fungicola]|uniref:Uncharacterized protein n=1 Tax=Zarea fungicola TaxID=93591 RepID=A0ACC1NGB9_9HYPO|nr:hypothetical protein NQ176_g4082 [Lecanicillium fungicola]